MSRRTWTDFDLRLLYRRRHTDKVSLKDLAAEYRLTESTLSDRLWRARRLIRFGAIKP